MASSRERERGVSRRGFLGAAAVAGAPLIVPAAALGRDGVPPNERIQMAVLGVGSRGGGHTNALLGRDDVTILGLCDPYQSKREAAKGRVEQRYAARKGKGGAYKGCQTTSDFREIVSRDDIDAVVVAAPEFWHGLLAGGAAKAGIDCYGEKALTLTVGEGQALCRTIRRYNRVFQTGTQQRSDRKFRFACELARNGYLGDLKTVKVGVPGGRSLPIAQPKPPPPDIDYEMWLGPAPYTPYNDLKCSFNWYFVYDYCVGWIQSWGVHHCDIALWGAPALCKGKVEVEGSATFPTEGLADTSITWDVNVTTPDGLRCNFSDNGKNRQGCRFEGTEGWVQVNRGGIQAEPASLLRLNLKPGDERLYESNNHHGNFLECVRSRRDPVAPVEAGHAATVFTLVADIATRTQRKLTWDWEAERFADDEGANRFLTRPMRSPWRM